MIIKGSIGRRSEFFLLNSCNGKIKIPLALMNRFKSASIPAMQVIVLLIVHLWYGSDSPREI
jgi:uncharacterized membrane protein YhaH (DUF805 family)